MKRDKSKTKKLILTMVQKTWTAKRITQDNISTGSWWLRKRGLMTRWKHLLHTFVCLIDHNDKRDNNIKDNNLIRQYVSGK